ncbi:MAG: Glycerophosphodiester phosphodiesterase, periplasmic [Chloroflexi bacterium]|nr:Glycerophosphodiester phosphodiesterase, periplasmic [Chloroflexota bacterium]
MIRSKSGKNRILSALGAFLLAVSLVVAGLVAIGCPAPAAAPAVEADNSINRQIVIAHRGASGYLPEHTLEAYAMAHGMGADYIEPDLVMTKDGILICLHDIHLERTTNVEEVFPDRAREDGRWYVADFTLAEIRQLRAHEVAGADGTPRFPDRFPMDLSRFEVPTFAEMIELVQGLNKSTGRNVGIYPEIKRPGWHREQGLPMEEALLEILHQYGFYGPDAKVFIQSFEAEPLKRLRFELQTNLPLVLLTWQPAWDYGVEIGTPFVAELTEDALDQIATYADGIGVFKERIEANPDLVRWARERGLLVHTWTMRADVLPDHFRTFEEELYRFYVTYNVDGIFTGFPDRGVQFLHGLGRRN